MKRMLSLLSLATLIFLSACGQPDTPPQSKPLDQQPNLSEGSEKENTNLYTNEAYGYALVLPQEIADSCQISQQENTVYFAPTDESDAVMMLSTVSDDDFQDGLTGQVFLGTKDGYTTYLQLPTCGTLDNESLRQQWESLVDAAGGITQEDFSYNQ